MFEFTKQTYMAAVFALSKFNRAQKVDVKSVHSCFLDGERVRSPSRAFALPKSGPLFSVQEGGTLCNGPHFSAKRGAEHLLCG